MLTTVSSDEIDELRELLLRLRQADGKLRVSGAEYHKYRLRPTLTEAELQRFEQTHQVKLPEDYRMFLREVGNGEAGPFQGLDSLERVAQGRDLSKPFPFTEATDSCSDEDLNQWGDNEFGGILELCDCGCAIHCYLVLNGPAYGTIWEGREDLYPCEMSFGVWYRRWLERSLRILANEPLVAKLTLGMTKEQVVATTGGDWKEKRTADDKYYFEAPEIAAQLILSGEDGIVKEIKPWSSI
jgi:hypothetical protein